MISLKNKLPSVDVVAISQLPKMSVQLNVVLFSDVLIAPAIYRGNF